jgi:hypothetical protein
MGFSKPRGASLSANAEAQQMMNKPVSDPLSKVIKIVARHREQTPDLRSKCRR